MHQNQQCDYAVAPVFSMIKLLYVVLQVLLPPKARGTVTYLAPPGNYTIKDKILETEFDGQKTEYTLMQVSNYPLCLSNSIMLKKLFSDVIMPTINSYL